MYIVLAILGFSVLILGHELGHFTLAKLNGVKVEEFSLGMGPKIIGIKGKETEYLIKALPIGGYVKMLGEEEKSDDPRSFANKSAARRLSIIAAGPIMNLILAIVFFMIIAYGNGFNTPIISSVLPDSPAANAKLKTGDKVVEINNKKVNIWEDFTMDIVNNGSKPMGIIVKRGNENVPLTITPAFNKQENRYIIGIEGTYVSRPSVGEAVNYGYQETKYFIKETFNTFKTLFAGKLKANDVGGPVTIIKLSGQAAKAGIWTLMWFCAFLSVQLAIFNVIPFPALDGGWIFILLFEIITRKKIDDNKVAIVNYIGFAILMMLMVLVTLKDIFYPIKF